MISQTDQYPQHIGHFITQVFRLNLLDDGMTVNPGEIKKLDIDVEPGTYRYVCRVLDHEEGSPVGDGVMSRSAMRGLVDSVSVAQEGLIRVHD